MSKKCNDTWKCNENWHYFVKLEQMWNLKPVSQCLLSILIIKFSNIDKIIFCSRSLLKNETMKINYLIIYLYTHDSK